MQQLGISDALIFAWGMFLEVPTGAIADLLGKRKTVIAAFIFNIIGGILVTTALGSVQLLLGFVIFMSGIALYSGSLEALVYESLAEKKLEKHFDTVISKSQQIALLATVFTSSVGGFLFTLSIRAPFGAFVIWNCIALLITFFLTEPTAPPEHFSLKQYFAQFKQGFVELTQPALRPYGMLFFTLLGIFTMYDEGFLRIFMATRFGLNGELQGYVVGGIALISSFTASQLPRLRKSVSDSTGITILGLLMGVAFLLTGFISNTLVGLGVLLTISICGTLILPWISVIINRFTNSASRATTISTLSLISKTPYVFLAVIIGWLTQNNQFHFVMFSIAVWLGITSFLHKPIPKGSTSATASEIGKLDSEFVHGETAVK